MRSTMIFLAFICAAARVFASTADPHTRASEYVIISIEPIQLQCANQEGFFARWFPQKFDTDFDRVEFKDATGDTFRAAVAKVVASKLRRGDKVIGTWYPAGCDVFESTTCDSHGQPLSDRFIKNPSNVSCEASIGRVFSFNTPQ